jgi:hypothetical protein
MAILAAVCAEEPQVVWWLGVAYLSIIILRPH